MFVFRFLFPGARRTSSYTFCYLALGALLTGLLLASCTNPFGSSPSPTPTATLAANLPLAKLSWCGKPNMLFRDEGAIPTVTATVTGTTTPAVTATAGGSPTATVTVTASSSPTAAAGPGTPTTLADWKVVKADLGFSVFLPVNLPRATCLVSAQATVHDPTFGGSFLIGYLLPDHTSITISEAPLTSQSAAFQCNVSNNASTQKSGPSAKSAGTPLATVSPTSTPIPLQLCSGARDTTNIVLSARRSIEYLQQVFNGLQSNVDWIPAA